jgi:3alpha(or 20beta)-hydroxysteroid dehydrogenase
MGRLNGKIAIVTGGAQGQGAEIVRAFVAEGARVAIADVATEPGEVLAKELGDATFFAQHDVSSEVSWQALVADVTERFGAVTTLVNNAGILRFGAIDETTVEEYEQVFRVNQLGTFLGMKSVVPTMKAQHSGSIVNTSSIEGLGGMGHLVAYSATKFAIRGMTKVAAMELGGSGVRVNSVHPGMIDTGMTREHGGDVAMEFGASKVALKRVGTPADVSPLYVYLASDESLYVTGAEIAVDGGATATHSFGG